MSKQFERVRDLYGMATAWNSDDMRHHAVIMREALYTEFDEMIAQVRAEAKAEALRDVADELEPSDQHESPYIKAGRDIIRIIRNRADQEGDDD